MKLRSMKLILLSVVFSSIVYAQDGQEIAVLKELPAKSLSVTSDFQWLSGINKIDYAGYTTSSSFARFHLGAGYRLSEIAKLSADFPFGLLQVQTDMKMLGPTTSQMGNTEIVTDRLKLGIEGLLFPASQIGDISWNARTSLPTIFGNVDYDNRFFNHTSVAIGLSDIYHLSGVPAYTLGSFSYITNFSATYKREERDYGDEYAVTVGGGYRVAKKVHTLLQMQGSYVQPYTSKVMGTVLKAQSSAFAAHLIPGISIPLRNNFSIRGQSRMLLHRTKIDRQDAGPLWGNFEDASTFSFQLGIRLGIL